MRHASFALLSSLALVGCSTAATKTVSVDGSRGEWGDQCYEGFAEDVETLAGPDAVDCGFHAGMGANRGDIKRWQACAREAVASGRPFKFGYRSFGIDSAFCHTAIRTPEGELLSWFLDFDVTGGSSERARSALWASGCKDIAFEAGTIGHGSFFDLKECSELTSGRAWEIQQARVR